MANHLTILARQWKSADENDELPEALYDALVGENNTAYERRVIKALSRATRIVNNDGSIRDFSELVKDWEYSHSVYGHTSVCQACGKKDIVQNCYLKNKEDGVTELIVGSTCVFRYMEIVIDGILLEGEEKEEWLRVEMNAAKREFRRQMFLARYPTVMGDLERYEPLTHHYSNFGVKRTYRYRYNPIGKLFKAMGKRMVKFGYPGPQLEDDWARFMNSAEDRLTEHNDFMEQANKERLIREENSRLLQTEREDRWTLELERQTAERDEKASDFLTHTAPLEATMNQWEQNARLQIADRLRKGTPLRGYTNTVKEWQNRISVMDGAEVEHPVFKQLEELDESTLNDWEKNFRQSIMARLAGGRELTKKQASAIARMMKGKAGSIAE